MDDYFDEDYHEEHGEEDEGPGGSISFLPTIKYYEKLYGISLGQNDQKAVSVFADYEPKEKLRRLQTELLWVKEGRATEAACDTIIGKKRKHRHRQKMTPRRSRTRRSSSPRRRRRRSGRKRIHSETPWAILAVARVT